MAKTTPTKTTPTEITIKDLVKGIKSTNPNLSGMADGRATTLLREAFKLINEQVAQTEDDIVKIPALGRFRVKSVEIKKDDKPATTRRVIFHPAQKKPEKA